MEDGLSSNFLYRALLEMKVLLASAGILSLLWAALAQAPLKAGQNQSAECAEAIASSGAQMSGVYKVPLVEVTTTAIPDYYNSPFRGSNKRVVFALGSDDPYARTAKGRQEAARINNFLASSQVQLALARRVLDKCEQVNAVEFALSGSGYVNTFFRMPSGKYQGAIPLPCDPVKYPGQAPWGYSKIC